MKNGIHCKEGERSRGFLRVSVLSGSRLRNASRPPELSGRGAKIGLARARGSGEGQGKSERGSMEVFILRHGVAEEASASGLDADRQLTGEGVEKIRRTALSLQRLNLEFDRIISSPYARARRTAEVVQEVLGKPALVEFSERLVPSAAAAGAIELIRQRGKAVLVVGHEPHLSSLASLLLTGTLHLSLILKKGGLVRISCHGGAEAGNGMLEWLLAPKHLTRLE